MRNAKLFDWWISSGSSTPDNLVNTNISDTTASFTWDGSGSFERATQSDFSDASVIYTGATGYTDTGLTQDTTYYYRIGGDSLTILTFTEEYQNVIDYALAA